MSRTHKSKVQVSSDGTAFVSVTIKVPKPLNDALERALRAEDTDRSKFIRKAVAERLQTLAA